jgi:HK97 family phage portal protein
VSRFRGDDPRREQRFFRPWAIAGMNLTPDEALSISTVWACMSIIAQGIGPMRWKLFQPIPGTKKRLLLDDDWKTWMLNTQPNPEMTAIGWREAMLFQAVPFGNAYSEIVRDKAGRVVQLWPLWSDQMRPRRDPVTRQLVYEYTQANGEVVPFEGRDIFHLRGPGLYGLMGENIIARAAKTLGVAAAQERFAGSYFGQGAQPGGVLKATGKVSDTAYERLKADWAEKRKGPENAHKPLILEEGMTWEQTAVDPEKSQLVESRKFSVEDICRWLRVPPHMVQQLDRATFSNIEHQSIEFTRYTLTPWERRLCQECDVKVLNQTRAPFPYSEIDLRPLERGDAQSRALAAASWRQNGIKSANEIRAEEGFDDCGDDGDVLLVQSNMTTIENILNPPVPMLPPGAPQPGGESDTGDDEDLDPETDDPAEQPSITSLARQALIAAIGGTLERYATRLLNQQKRKARADQLEEFRQEQAAKMAMELRGFSSFSVVVLGREVSPGDMAAAIRLFETGQHPETIVENHLKQLPG